jgi:hypothetical protein
MRTTRQDALARPCPTCGARPGRNCVGRRGKARTACHADRYLAPPPAVARAELAAVNAALRAGIGWADAHRGLAHEEPR